MAIATVNQADTDNDNDQLDMHRAYQRAAECGFTKDLLLHSSQAQNIAARLRGIDAITAVLMVDDGAIDVGEFIRGGLIEAVRALADDANSMLESINTRAQKQTLARA